MKGESVYYRVSRRNSKQNELQFEKSAKYKKQRIFLSVIRKAGEILAG